MTWDFTSWKGYPFYDSKRETTDSAATSGLLINSEGEASSMWYRVGPAGVSDDPNYKCGALDDIDDAHPFRVVINGTPTFLTERADGGYVPMWAYTNDRGGTAGKYVLGLYAFNTGSTLFSPAAHGLGYTWSSADIPVHFSTGTDGFYRLLTSPAPNRYLVGGIALTRYRETRWRLTFAFSCWYVDTHYLQDQCWCTFDKDGEGLSPVGAYTYSGKSASCRGGTGSLANAGVTVDLELND